MNYLYFDKTAAKKSPKMARVVESAGETVVFTHVVFAESEENALEILNRKTVLHYGVFRDDMLRPSRALTEEEREILNLI